MDITIRRGNRGDLEQIMNLWLTGNRQGNDFVNEDYWELHYNQVRDLLLQARVYVAEGENRQIIGFVTLLGKHIAGLFVAALYRGQGIGKLLLQRCKLDRSVLTLQVYAKNEGAFRFYQREGFLITQAQLDTEVGAMAYSMAWTSVYDDLKQRRAMEC